MRSGVTTRPIVAYSGHTHGAIRREDAVAVEGPLEIRVDDVPVSLTMRTPGHDDELAAGFLVSEGVVGARADVLSLERTGRDDCVVLITLSEQRRPRLAKLLRYFTTSSACGVCGRASAVALRRGDDGPLELDDAVRIEADTIVTLPSQLRQAQGLFDATGGMHAAALFDESGTLVLVREDVGRHNAVDKLIGERVLRDALPLTGAILLVTSRASYEIVQKAGVARIPIVLAVGAPSSLAIDLADELGITLAAFVRDGRFNVYCGAERIRGLGADA